MRVSAGQVARWAYHRARLERAAQHFRYPWAADRIEREVSAAASILREGRLRLLLGADGALALEPGPLPVTPPRPVVVLAREPIDGSSEFVRHKTTRREHYERLALEEPAVFDTLLWNARGELTEFTRGNVAVRIEGQWYTPPSPAACCPESCVSPSSTRGSCSRVSCGAKTCAERKGWRSSTACAAGSA